MKYTVEDYIIAKLKGEVWELDWVVNIHTKKGYWFRHTPGDNCLNERRTETYEEWKARMEDKQ